MYVVKGELDALGRLSRRGGRALLRGVLQAGAAAERGGPPGHERGARSGGGPFRGRGSTRTRKRRKVWRGKAQAFRNLYAFLSQVIPYQDSDLERLYVYLRHLSAKLPRRRPGPAYRFDDEVRLEYYRLQKIGEGSIPLAEGDAQALDGPTEVGSGAARAEEVPLSRLIDVVNERFGADFTEADQLFFDQVVEAAVSDGELRRTAAVNPEARFGLVFRQLIERLFVERMDQNEDIFVRFMNDPAFQGVVTEWMASEGVPAPARGGRRGSRSRRAGRRRAAVPGGAGRRPRSGTPPACPWCRWPSPPAGSATRGPSRRRTSGSGSPSTPAAVCGPGMFVARVVGRSMEPAIPDGAWCLFAAPVTGTRQGRIVLAALRDAVDSGDRRALHRQALPEREDARRRHLAPRRRHPPTDQPRLPAPGPRRRGRRADPGGGGVRRGRASAGAVRAAPPVTPGRAPARGAIEPGNSNSSRSRWAESEYIGRPFFVSQIADLGPEQFQEAQGDPVADLMEASSVR